MSSNNINQSPFLRTTRSFPKDSDKLPLEMDKSYLDIANAVNERTIGIYSSNTPVTTGNSYFITKNQKQQTLRQVYTFGAIAAGAPLNIPIKKYLPPYVLIYGTCQTAFPDSRPIPYASVTANSNIEILVDPNPPDPMITIKVGASSPAVVSGIVILEWLSSP